MKRIEFLLVLISIYIPLFVANIFIDKLNLLKASKETQKLELFNYQNNTKEKMKSYEKQGYSVYIPPGYIFKEALKKKIFPIGSKILTKTYLCDEGYGLIKYKTDRFGLRNQDEKWDRLLNNKDKEVSFFIGDSFVQGACVDEKNTIPIVFENKTKITSFNIGNGGTDGVEYKGKLKFLKQIIDKTDKKVNIFLIFYPNDNNKKGKDDSVVDKLDFKSFLNLRDLSFNESYVKSLNTIYESKSLNSGKVEEIFLDDRKKISFLEMMKRFFALSHLKYYLAHIFGVAFFNDYSETSRTATSISSLSDVCKLPNCSAYVGILPNSNFWRPDQRAQNYAKHIKYHANKNKIEFVDLRKSLNSNNKSNFAPYGAHNSKKGYRKIGNYLAEIYLNKK